MTHAQYNVVFLRMEDAPLGADNLISSHFINFRNGLIQFCCANKALLTFPAPVLYAAIAQYMRLCGSFTFLKLRVMSICK